MNNYITLYEKTLSKEELCHFDKAGNFVLKGNNKLNKQKTFKVDINY